MTLMNADRIRSAQREGLFEIENFSEKSVQPASYNCRLGDEAITSSQREKVNPSQKGLLTIPAGDFALVKTMERFNVSSRAAGHIGLRSHYAKMGLDILAGPQIDPGFEGYLVVGLTNLSPRDITIPYGEEFCTIELYEFAEAVSQPYEGEYQGQTGITGRDLEHLVDSQGMTFGEVIRSIGALSTTVHTLSDRVTTLVWLVPVVLAVGLAVISAVIAIGRPA